MIPLHALVLVLMGRFSDRLYVAYSTWYAIGTLASMQVPFVGFQPVSTSEHMGALGIKFFLILRDDYLIFVFRRFRTPSDRGVCATCANSRLFPTISKTSSSRCCFDRRFGSSSFRFFDL